MQHTARFSAPFAVVPFVFLYILLSMLLPEGWSDHLIVLFPLGLMGLILLAPIIMRGRSGLPLRVPGHPPMTGGAKRRALTVAGLIIMVLIAYVIWGPIAEARFVNWLRETMTGWRI